MCAKELGSHRGAWEESIISVFFCLFLPSLLTFPILPMSQPLTLVLFCCPPIPAAATVTTEMDGVEQYPHLICLTAPCLDFSCSPCRVPGDLSPSPLPSTAAA